MRIKLLVFHWIKFLNLDSDLKFSDALPDKYIPAKTYIAGQINILNKLKGKSFYRKSTLAARAQMLLSPEDRALSKQVLADYKKAFKKAPAEKEVERDIFRFRVVLDKFLNFEC